MSYEAGSIVLEFVWKIAIIVLLIRMERRVAKLESNQ